MPYFSVVIPLYNKEKFIEDTLKSVLNQTFNDFEVIIVNDGSSDNSLSIVEQFKSEKIRLFTNKNRGLSYTRNFGIKKAKSQYIGFLDADDLWANDFLETVYNSIKEHPQILVYATKVKPFRNGKDVLTTKKNKFTKDIVISDFASHIKFPLGLSSLVVKNTIFKEVGFFDETINYGEEHDFFIRCFKKHDLVYINNCNSYYRIGIDNQLTAPNKNFKRIIPEYESYLIDNTKPGLKIYLDNIHYLFMVLFKAERSKEKVLFYKKKIDVKNLSFVQKIKYYIPTWAFYYSKRIYIWLRKCLF
ncbi:glycosyltransferase family 2 protein [Flavisericum labens]|uniref:glycosyltransferase family 2 protein n=1 Tax=Flavisericum labens TaxID=3377112 RepID=UPI00387B3CED